MSRAKTVKKPKEGIIADPYKTAEFETYVMWHSLPPMMRGQPKESLERMGFDESAVELLEIKNQTAFAEKYGIGHPGTLSEWNKKIDAEPELKNRTRDWAKKLTKNVVAALYRKALVEGDAARVRVWLEYVGDMEPENGTGPQTINTQFNQFVLNLGRDQQGRIREYLVEKITDDAKKRGEIPSDERLRADRADKGGKVGQDSSRGSQEKENGQG